MIRCDGTVPRRKPLDQLTKIERPSGIPVEHDHRFSAALVNVMHPPSVHIHIPGGERIEMAEAGDIDGKRNDHEKFLTSFSHHLIPNMRQFNPLPIPKKPTTSPETRNPRSSAIAAVIGSETVPMLPRWRNVEKSRSAGIPIASRMVR